MTGDPYIGEMLAILRAEANPHNHAQAETWRRLMNVFVAFADAIDRHTTALTDAWDPTRNSAAAAFIRRVEDLRRPLNAAALDAAGANGAALRAIADSAAEAHRRMQTEYDRSVVSSTQWTTITPTLGAETALLTDQQENRRRAHGILERYKTDVAQAGFQEPPAYEPPMTDVTFDASENKHTTTPGVSASHLYAKPIGSSGASRGTLVLGGSLSGDSPPAPQSALHNAAGVGGTDASRSPISSVVGEVPLAAPTPKAVGVKSVGDAGTTGGGMRAPALGVPPIVAAPPTVGVAPQSIGRSTHPGVAPAIVGQSPVNKSPGTLAGASQAVPTTRWTTTGTGPPATPTSTEHKRSSRPAATITPDDPDESIWFVPRGAPAVITVESYEPPYIDPGPAIGR